MKILGINEEKLLENGFVRTVDGFRKNIPNMFRFSWNLYILKDDIYGTVEGKNGSDEVDDYEDWLENMKFRNEEKVEVVKKLVEDLIESGAITVQQ